MSRRSHRYSLYGFRVESDRELGLSTAATGEAPDLLVEELSANLQLGGTPLYTSPVRGAQGESLAHAYRLPAGLGLAFPGAAEFLIAERSIGYRLTTSAGEELFEVLLLGTAVTCWLEQRGTPVLHGAAAAGSRAACGFVAAAGGGKSTLAGTMVRSGARLVADDLLALTHDGTGWVVLPGPPHMRLWPQEAHALFPTTPQRPVWSGVSKLRIALPDAAAPRSGATRLVRLFLLSRREGSESETRIRPLTRQEALIGLLRNAAEPGLTRALGIEAARVRRLARLVSEVPVLSLELGSGAPVREALARDLLESLA